MAMARRESLRTHAVDIANVVGMSFDKDASKRADWNRFIKTGQLGKREQRPIRMTPLIQKAYDQIAKDGGRFILENLERN